jgi:hypothetical protein
MSEAPTVRDYSYKDLVIKADPEHYEADDCYEFSNGKTFKSTDGNGSSIYE